MQVSVEPRKAVYSMLIGCEYVQSVNQFCSNRALLSLTVGCASAVFHLNSCTQTMYHTIPFSSAFKRALRLLLPWYTLVMLQKHNQFPS